MRISDWSSDVCSSDLVNLAQLEEVAKTADNTDYFFKASADPDNDSVGAYVEGANATAAGEAANAIGYGASAFGSGAMALAEYTTATGLRSDEHTSELQSLMRISYAVFCLKKNNYKWSQ